MKRINKLGIAAFLCCGLSCTTKSLTENETDTGKTVKTEALAAGDFTIVVMPDTQNYMSGYFGATYAMFTAQIDWIKANKTAMNIAYVVGVGDIVEHGDESAYASEWTEAATNGY